MAEHEKFPCFNFFPTNWLAGTAVLTAEQKGVFADLLSYSWEQTPPCTLPDNEVQLARMGGVSLARWRRLAPAVLAKFVKVEGRLRNPKLWSIYLDMVAHRGRRREAGSKGNAMRWQSDPNAIAMRSPPTPSPTKESTSLDHPKEPVTATSFPHTAREEGGSSSEIRGELAGLIDAHAKTIDNSMVRKRFVAGVVPLVDGSDFIAWQDKNGSQIPWPDRPNLLRLALAHMAGTGGALRPALRYVIPQQRDPFPPKVNHAPPPGSPAYEEYRDGDPEPRRRNTKQPAPQKPELVRATQLAEWETAHPDRSLELKEKAESQIAADPKTVERPAKVVEAMTLGVYQTMVFRELNQAGAA